MGWSQHVNVLLFYFLRTPTVRVQIDSLGKAFIARIGRRPDAQVQQLSDFTLDVNAFVHRNDHHLVEFQENHRNESATSC